MAARMRSGLCSSLSRPYNNITTPGTVHRSRSRPWDATEYLLVGLFFLLRVGASKMAIALFICLDGPCKSLYVPPGSHGR